MIFFGARALEAVLNRAGRLPATRRSRSSNSPDGEIRKFVLHFAL